MVNGDAAGGGCDLALACDLHVASKHARFMESFARIGLFPGTGGCWFPPRQVGLAKASEMMFTGAPLGAEDAYRIGVATPRLLGRRGARGASAPAGTRCRSGTGWN
jgi:enoyl-CoA hydratase/carnithine racemase